jgi:DNA (cytosine-5)-methyltransferase 1
MIMRRDGRPIVWPEPTHGDPNSYAVKSGRLKPWRTAAEIIDWSIPCPSIFERKKPLAENTLRRIARGMFKFIINEENPFIAPIRSSTVADHGELVTAFLAQYYTETVPGEVRGQSLNSPIMTIPTANRFALVTSHLVKFKGTNIGQPMTEPLQTITAGGNHFAECRAFLIKYYGQGVGQGLNEPLHTIPTKDRFGLVMVHGTPYQIIDIGMRMLEPHELFAGNGFPQSYIIDRGADGRRYPKSEQVARCGNSVPPAFAKALVQANLPELCTGSGKQFAFYRYNPTVTPSGQLELSI